MEVFLSPDSSQGRALLTSFDRTASESGTHSFPEIVALRLLVELRGRVAQVSMELSRKQGGGADTMRMAVLKLGFETPRTAKLRAAYAEIRVTVSELADTVRLAGLPTYVAICKRVIVHLEPLSSPNDVTLTLLDVFFEWIEASLAYLGATPSDETFPEALALFDCVYDPRWDGLYEFAAADQLRDGLIEDRRRGKRSAAT